MKTITELNNKWWYRLIKVIYTVLFITIFIIYNYIISINGIREIDTEKTVITCNQNNYKKMILEKIGIYLSPQELKNYNYENFFKENNYKVQTIIGTCDKGEPYTVEGRTFISKGIVSADDVYRFQAMGDSKEKLDALPFSSWIEFNTTDWEKYITYKTHLYEIEPSFSYSKFIYNFVLGNLIILISYILLQGIFYYVIIGNFKPRKI